MIFFYSIALLSIIVGLCYYVYLLFTPKKNLLQKEDNLKENPRIAILIPARNESLVIEELLKSIENQSHKINSQDVYVIVENENDPTVKMVQNHKMSYFVRKKLHLKTKGYALAEMLEDLEKKKNFYDIYFIFDADNVLDKDFIKYMLEDINSIKKAITKYGAVTIIYPVRSDLFHSVSIVGWNDANKSWLVKDSAKAFNYTNLPYSTTIVECSCFTDAEKFHSDQKIYQHDNFCSNCVYASTSPYTNSSNKITVANVFEFSGKESLDYITMYSTSENSKLNLFCAPVLPDGTPSNSRYTWKNLYCSTIPYKGYFTIKLNNKINLDKNKYAIIAQIEKTNTSKELPNIGCQSPCEKLILGPSKPGKSFILLHSRFYDIFDVPTLHDISGFSLKAITKIK